MVVIGLALFASLTLFPIRTPDPISIGVLLGLAILCELFPVRVPSRDLRVSLSLPFIAAIAVVDGVATAMVADLVALAIGMAAVGFQGERIRAYWVLMNLAIGAAASLAGGILMSVLHPVQGVDIPGHFFASIFFIVGYALVNLSLSLLVEQVFGRTLALDNLGRVLKNSWWVLGLYLAFGPAASVMRDLGLVALVPMFLAPVLAFRYCFEERNRALDNYRETIHGLTTMLNRSHPYTSQHLDRVGEAVVEVGRRLGVRGNRLALLREAALLHDIGKIAVDESVLDKPARLTEEEMTHVRKHAQWGADILEPAEDFGPIVHWIRHHHERPDGTGYPSGLKDGQIPLESKIIAVLDAFDAMTGDETTGRSYRTPMSREQALAELARCAGTQFDPEVVRVFSDVARLKSL